jgi:alpha-tubulin suppressor-like RCC1 family protein
MGEFSTCALIEGGSVRCWGSNLSGQLGNGSTDALGDNPGEMPPPDVALGGTAVAVFSGARADRACAILQGGGLRCWGGNSEGELGYGHTDNVGDAPGEMPPPDVPVGGGVVQISTNLWHTCARLASGAVRCWGRNMEGQLGYGNTDALGDNSGELPTADVSLGGPAANVAVGNVYTCSLMVGGAVRCWGKNDKGQLGYSGVSTLGDAPGQMPPPDVAIGGTASQISVGNDHTCVLLDTGGIRCWGSNSEGQLGYGHTNDLGAGSGDMPRPDVQLGGKAVQVATGTKHSCALLESGTVKCWGGNAYGQLGYGNTSNVGDTQGQMPPADVAIGGKAVLIAAGGYRTCAVLDSGALRCWGDNSGGSLGYGDEGIRGDEPGELPTADIQVGGKLSPGK